MERGRLAELTRLAAIAKKKADQGEILKIEQLLLKEKMRLGLAAIKAVKQKAIAARLAKEKKKRKEALAKKKRLRAKKLKEKIK